LIISNCREGYNDPDIAAIAVFRPVSEAASALAEQMKGRGSRVLRGLIEGVEDQEERLRLISESVKPNCLIVDLVGITGLADCASTVSIYAEGLPDEVCERAEKILLDGVDDVEEAIEQAERDIAEERERIKREREEAEKQRREEYQKRARADARVEYSEHDVGHGGNRDPKAASSAQYKYMKFLGLWIRDREITKRQAGRMIDMLIRGTPIDEVAYKAGIGSEHWEHARPSVAQQRLLARNKINGTQMTPSEASDVISAMKEPVNFEAAMTVKLYNTTGHEELTNLAKRLVLAKNVLGYERYSRLVMLGRERRKVLDEDDF